MDAPIDINFDTLPDIVLIHIFGYLDHVSLSRCSLLCKRCNDIISDDGLWQILCHSQFLHTSRDEECTWYETFQRLYTDYGRYLPNNTYKTIRRAWTQIELYLERYCEETYELLNPPIEDEALDRLEQRHNVQFPEPLRCMYRIHNGQTPDLRLGVMGAVEVYNYRRSDNLLSAHLSIQYFSENLSVIILSRCMRSMVMNVLGMPGPKTLFPVDRVSNLNPEILTKLNQILQQNFDIVDNSKCFITGDSFQSWFCEYAENLANDRYPRIESMSQVMRYLQDPASIATTDSVTVSVATVFLPELTGSSHYYHAYHITITMDEEAHPDDTCKLATRHWDIVDGDGNEETVDGDGVIGEYPVLKPGGMFRYCSSTTFPTEQGRMRGYYDFVNLNTGIRLRVEVPEFHMAHSPVLTYWRHSYMLTAAVLLLLKRSLRTVTSHRSQHDNDCISGPGGLRVLELRVSHWLLVCYLLLLPRRSI